MGLIYSIELMSDVLHVELDRPLAYPEYHGNLPVGLAVLHPLKDLRLPSRERLSGLAPGLADPYKRLVNMGDDDVEDVLVMGPEVVSARREGEYARPAAAPAYTACHAVLKTELRGHVHEVLMRLLVEDRDRLLPRMWL